MTAVPASPAASRQAAVDAALLVVADGTGRADRRVAEPPGGEAACGGRP